MEETQGRYAWGRKREGLCTSRRLGEKEGEKGKEGRRRHVCRSMIYRLHCHHGDFCQPSLRSKVVVQTIWGREWGGNGVQQPKGVGLRKGGRGRKVEGALTKIPSSNCLCACRICSSGRVSSDVIASVMWTRCCYWCGCWPPPPPPLPPPPSTGLNTRQITCSKAALENWTSMSARNPNI